VIGEMLGQGKFCHIATLGNFRHKVTKDKVHHILRFGHSCHISRFV
jgi:hypothetical protein